MIGQTISHYKILAEIGKGGMGVVYQAEDLKLGRHVAIKFLPPAQVSDPEAKARFTQEAQAASALDHPNIGVIHEIDETGDGRLYIVMGHYEGGTLKERMRRRPLTLGEALDYVVQVAAGLARAHTHGIVHRDIKPANLLLAADGVLKIIDFGIAKLAGRSRFTRTGMTIGTIAYMSPEQVRGAATDQRADIFSLGVLLYELITGELPFTGDSDATVLYQIVNDAPTPLADHQADVPPALQQVLDRMLAKEPDRRYQHVDDLLADLELVRAGREPTVAVPLPETVLITPTGTATAPTALPPPQVTPQRSWRLILLAGLAVALLVTGYFLLRPETDRTEPADLAIAVIDFQDLATPDDLTVSAGLTGLIQVGLVESSPIRVVSPAYLYDLRRRLFGASRGPIAPEQALEIAREAGASLLLSGQLAVLDSTRYVSWMLVETAEGKSLAANQFEVMNLAPVADRIIAETLPVITNQSGIQVAGAPVPVTSLTTQSPQAYQYYIAGILARDGLKDHEILVNLEQAVALDSTFALAYFELSRTYYSGTNVGVQYGLAEENAHKAWELRTRLGVKDRMRLEAWRAQLDYKVAEAIQTYQEMLSRWPDDREILNNYHRILFYYRYGGEALAVATKGIELYPEDLYFGCFYQIGLSNLGRFDEALAATRDYLARHPREPNAWDELGIRYLGLGFPDSAEVAFRSALRLNPDFFPSQRGVSWCAYSSGDLDSAIILNERLLAKDSLLPGQRVQILTDITFWPGLALLHLELGQYEQALQCFETARSPDADPTSEFWLEIGRNLLLLRMGRAAEVLEWAETLVDHPAKRLAPITMIRFRAQALAATGALEQAKAAVTELFATETEWGGVARFEALKATAAIALAENHPQAALDALDQLAQHGIIEGGIVDLEYRDTRARALHQAGRPEEAIAILQQMLRVYGGHALAHFELGKIYEELGRTDEARSAYMAFLETWAGADPGLAQVAEARERLDRLRSAP
ncbi:MAG: protein kinase [bacterium]